MDLTDIKKINLTEYAKNRYGYKCDSKGSGSCLFHPPDKHKSFSIWQGVDGVWRFKCFHEGVTGTIVDLKIRMEGIGEKDSCKELLKEFGSPQNKQSVTKKPAKGKKIKSRMGYMYKDQKGNEVYRKVKVRYEDSSKDFYFEHPEGKGWHWGKGKSELIPYNVDLFKDFSEVTITEGEKDANTINGLKLGFLATSAPTGKGSWPDSLTKYFKGFKKVTFVYDVGAEKNSEDHAAKLQKAFPELEIYIARIPLEKENSDITDYLMKSRDKSMDLLDLIDKSERFKEKSADDSSKPILTRLETITPEQIDWLWWNRIPLGKLTLIVGDPGHGKSYLCLYLAAHVTTGKPWPDLGAPIAKGSVILLTTEDGIADTVRIRADAMGADCSKIYIFEGVKKSSNEELVFFNLIKHISFLEKAIKRIRDVRLIIIDPITAYLGNIEANSNAAIRAALAPPASLAEKERVAIVGVSHLNKDVAKRAVYRAMGSVAFIAAARAVWAISRDEEDDEHRRRFLTPLKTNLSVDPSSLAFSIGNEGVLFEPEPVDITIEEALSVKEEEEMGLLGQAIEWLGQFFEDENHIPATEIMEQAAEYGISERTLKRAKKRLGIGSEKQGLAKDRKWVWIK